MKALRDQLADTSDQADLTPMLDCIFLLLLFFIVASTFSEETNLFQIELPSAAQAAPVAAADAVKLGIDSEGRFVLNDAFVPEEELYGKLGGLLAGRGAVLVIHGDHNCPYDKVVLAMDMAQALKAPRVSLAVNR
jgi:biopolymer transport protein ExbD